MGDIQDTEVGARIRKARIEKGLTHEELAELVGKSRRTIQNWEDGKHPYSHLEQIAEHTKTWRSTRGQYRWLLEGDTQSGWLRQLDTRLREIMDELRSGREERGEGDG